MAECRSTSKHKHKLQRGEGIDRFNCQTQDRGTRIFLLPQLRTSPPSFSFRYEIPGFQDPPGSKRDEIVDEIETIHNRGCKFAEMNRDDWIYLGEYV